MKKLLAILLALTLALTLVPTLAFAQNEDGAEPDQAIVEESKETPTEAPEGETTEEPKEEGGEEETKEEEPEGKLEDTGDVQAAPLLTAENTGLTGDGTAEKPYEIGTADDLKTFRDLVNGGEKDICAQLTADINLNNEAWTPIGTKDKPYSGKFNGSGKTISGLNVTGGEYAGLFGCTDGAAIWDMAVDGSVAGTKYAGGIAGYAKGSITGCVNLCSVSASGSEAYAGGIAGYFSNGSTVKNCANLGKISVGGSGSRYAGGIAGQIVEISISSCYNVGKVTDEAGGAVCVGSIIGSSINTHVQYYCWLTGTADKDLGQFSLASNRQEYSKSDFANGTALAWMQKGDGAWAKTGYVAAVDMFLPLLDWQKEDTPDLIGEGTEAEPYLIYTAEGLKDFRDKVNGGETAVYAELKDDIDLNNEPWTPIGTEDKQYSGSFNGNGHTISGLYVKDKVSAGLFGYTEYKEGNQIQNVAVTGSVAGTKYAGGIAGYAGLNIQSCVNLCRVVVSGNGQVCVGGIAGRAIKGSIADCTNIGRISGEGNDIYAGGIAGDISSGVASRCCNVGEVSVSGGTHQNVGGIAGHTIAASKCYYLTGTADRAVGESSEDSGTFVMTKAQFADGTVLAQLRGKNPASPWADECGYLAAAKMTLPLLSWQTADTFQINTAAELKQFRDMVNGGAAGLCGKLMNDIDLGSETWEPIGNADTPYSGTFDGNGKTISGLNVTGGDYAGLFGYTDNATIQNMAVSGTVKGTKYAGGIVGYATNKGGSIEGCVNQCLVSASGSEAYAGGIVGYLTNGSAVRNCANLKAISADGSNAYAGGIAGYMKDYPEISGCYNVGSITGSVTGSIAGNAVNESYIINCRWLVGTAEKIASGYPWTDIDNYSSDIAKSKAHFAEGTVLALLQNGDTSVWTKTGYLAAAGMTVPLLSWQTADSSHKHNTDGVLGGCTCGLLPEGKGKAGSPYEIATADDLKAFRDLVNGDLRLERGIPKKERCAKLTKDIVLNGGTFNEDGKWSESGTPYQWEPIKDYTDTFDGDGYTIKGLYAEGKPSGLFGAITSATIQNVTVTGYVSSQSLAGGIVGDVYGGTRSTTIKNCVNYCTVRSINNNAGGIVGYLSSGTLEISDCANYGTVISDKASAGGIVGYGSGSDNKELSFQRCLNAGRVAGGTNTGGIAGRILTDSSLTDCFNTGAVTGTGTNSSSYTGGIVGSFGNVRATMTYCYSVGAVTAPESAASGGLIGELSDNTTLTATNCYWLEGTAKTAIGNPAEANTSAKSKTQFADGTVLKLLKGDRTDSPWADECQYFVAAGMILPVFKGYSHTHSGGTATCKDKAVCEVCGMEYGALAPDKHTNLKHVEAKRATTRAEGNIEHWYCDGCGKYYKDEAAETEITQADTVIAKKRRPGSSDSTTDKTVKSSNTGDPGVMLYVGLAAMSLTGGAWLRRKKH